MEADGAGTRKASWLYCWDKAANLTSQDGSRNTCPGGTTYTYNDASELTGKNGSTTGWAYDKLGNETAGAGGTGRTTESWTDYSQLAGITADGTTYDLVHAGTSNAERTKLGSTWFHHTALGLVSTTTNGVDTGCIREPAGTLNSMRAGGKSYHYLTDATGNTPTPTAPPDSRAPHPRSPPPRAAWPVMTSAGCSASGHQSATPPRHRCLHCSRLDQLTACCDDPSNPPHEADHAERPPTTAPDRACPK
ncbi:hypothetical protein [Streptomyces sp. P9-1]|uniref:hypothetical protein n=1 Tax=Streptomyces sp. P9-1 TaxID=3422589 RepID=UPI003D36B84F